MQFLKTAFVLTALAGTSIAPSFAQDMNPNGTFVDSYGTSFKFSLCGEGKKDLCGTLVTLKGNSATPENLAFVGKQVMQAAASGPNEWKGSITAGGISADAKVTMTGPNSIDIQGCRSILCKTLTYNRS